MTRLKQSMFLKSKACSEEDNSLTSTIDASGLPQSTNLNAAWANGSEAMTITDTENKVCLCACGYTASAIGASTTTLEIKEIDTVLASVTEAYADDSGALATVMHIETDVVNTTVFTSLVGGGTGGGSLLVYQVFE